EHQLPVAGVRVLEDAAGDLELATRRAINEIVEGGLRRSQKIFQRRTIRRERSEDESAVGRDPRDRFEPQTLEALVAARERHRLQLARAVVAPAVIRADEALGVAFTFSAHHRAAVRAAIDERMDAVL